MLVSLWASQTLKNNNARLKTALQESASNVEEWKTQLTAWKEECIRLRAQVKELRASGDSANQASAELTTVKSECEDLRAKVAALEREKSALQSQCNVCTSHTPITRFYDPCFDQTHTHTHTHTHTSCHQCVFKAYRSFLFSYPWLIVLQRCTPHLRAVHPLTIVLLYGRTGCRWCEAKTSR